MTTLSKYSGWKDSSKDFRLPKSAAVSSPSSFLPAKTYPMSPNSSPKNKARPSTSRIEPTETQSSKHKSPPEKDSNYIKEPPITDLSSSAVELWTKTPRLRKNSFATSNPLSPSTYPFTAARASFFWMTWRSNSSLLNHHLVSLLSTVQEPFMQPCKAMPSKYWTSSQSSSPKSTIKEVNHQSDSLVLENKNVTTSLEKSVKLQLKLSSQTTGVTSQVWS